MIRPKTDPLGPSSLPCGSLLRLLRGDVQDPRCLLRSREDFQKPVIALAVVVVGSSILALLLILSLGPSRRRGPGLGGGLVVGSRRSTTSSSNPLTSISLPLWLCSRLWMVTCMRVIRVTTPTTPATSHSVCLMFFSSGGLVLLEVCNKIWDVWGS